MKCINCGHELAEGQHICPVCGQDHTLEKLLKEADIPQELDHLSLRQIGKHIRRLRFLMQKKFIVLLGIVVISVGIFFSSHWIYQKRHPNPIHNFHDDLVEAVSTNAVGNSNANIVNGGTLVLYGNQLYAASEGKLYCISLALDEKRITQIQFAKSMNIVQDTMYYINSEDNTVMVVDILKKNVVPTKIQALQLMAVGNYLYYLESGSHRAIYQVKNDFSESRALTQSDCLMFCVVDDWLYYSTKDAIYRVPVMGGEVTKLVEGYYSDFVVHNQMIYYQDAIGKVYRMKTDGSNEALLVDTPVTCFMVTDRYLFYASADAGIFRQSLETDELNQLSTDKAVGLQIAGSWIYYRISGSDEGYFVSVDSKSEGKTPIYSIKDK